MKKSGKDEYQQPPDGELGARQTTAFTENTILTACPNKCASTHTLGWDAHADSSRASTWEKNKLANSES